MCVFVCVYVCVRVFVHAINSFLEKCMRRTQMQHNRFDFIFLVFY